jgi:hypothetical protein
MRITIELHQSPGFLRAMRSGYRHDLDMPTDEELHALDAFDMERVLWVHDGIVRFAREIRPSTRKEPTH